MSKYEKFKQDIDRLTNIDLDKYKEKQMKRRIASIMYRNNFRNFEEYYRGLKADKELLNQFINYLTINVTEFYRNPGQWKTLEQEIIPNITSKGGRTLQLWSSACSTGEEPYTIVMMLTKYYNLKDIKVLATDIDEGVIKTAKQGIYNEKAVLNVPKEYLNRYFKKEQDKYIISDEIKSRVEFRKMDLLKDKYPTNMDLITCRNVMIYFTEDAKELLYERFYESLSDRGVLFVGSTEQIINPDKYGYIAPKAFFYSRGKRPRE